MSRSPMERYTLRQMQERFPDEDTCLEWLRHKLYPAKIYCINCRKPTKHHKISGRKVYGCDYCGHQISPTAGTIFHKSSTPLVYWFYAIYLMSQTRTGISAKQLERELGVTYKTAWRMFKEIRKRLNEGSSPFSGDVEVDETYVGGYRKGQDGHGASGKTPVVGVIQRKARVKGKTLTSIVQDTVERGANVHTDEWQGYSQLPALGYNHYTILHAAKIYAMGNVHTQTIEGFWAMIKTP